MAAQPSIAAEEAASRAGADGEAWPAALAALHAQPEQLDAEQDQQQQPEQLNAGQQEQQQLGAELGTATLVLEQAAATDSSGTAAPAATIGAVSSTTASSNVTGSSLVAASSAVAEADRADIVAAGALVAELTRSLQIDVAALSASERLQLVHTVLQAWQAQQAKRHGEAMAR